MDLQALGRTLQAARHDHGLTVGQLSDRAGVSTGLISQLERGQGNPSFLTLSRLAEALVVPLGHFLQGGAGALTVPHGTDLGSDMVVRAGQRKKLVLPEDRLVYELLTPGLQGSLEVLRSQIPSGWTNRERPFNHPGEECVHLISGSLEVTVGAESWTLCEGDAITYDSSVPHWWANTTDEVAVILGVVTPPSF